jgi:hypothetical protein
VQVAPPDMRRHRGDELRSAAVPTSGAKLAVAGSENGFWRRSAASWWRRPRCWRASWARTSSGMSMDPVGQQVVRVFDGATPEDMCGIQRQFDVLSAH